MPISLPFIKTAQAFSAADNIRSANVGDSPRETRNDTETKPLGGNSAHPAVAHSVGTPFLPSPYPSPTGPITSGVTCTPLIAPSIALSAREKSATIDIGFLSALSWRYGTKK